MIIVGGCPSEEACFFLLGLIQFGFGADFPGAWYCCCCCCCCCCFSACHASDFLHNYDWRKAIEHTVKTTVTEATIQPPAAYRERFLRSLDTYFQKIV